MLIGLVGEVLPGVPGMILIWAGALLYAILTHFQQVGYVPVLFLIFIWLVAVLINYVFIWLTAKHLNISWWGLGGTVLGAIIGLIVGNILGFLIGATLGAFLGEYYFQRHALNALKISGAVILGYTIGSVLKIVLAVSMILIFILAVII